MTGARKILGSLPAFLVGVAGAAAGEVSVGFLLFADEGLLQALTLILTVEMGALGLGLWSGAATMGESQVEHIRRRWLFCVVVFAFGAAVAGGLGVARDLSSTGVGQGLGLGFLGGLPLFAVGALLGSMSHATGNTDAPNPAVGPAAVLGAAFGFLLAGTFFIPNSAPYFIFLASLILLSGGALLHGWILDGWPLVEELEAGSSPHGEIRVERRILGSRSLELTTLMEGDRLRGAEGPDGTPGRPWEKAVEALAGHPGWAPRSFLLLGGGSGTLAHLLSRRIPDARVQVVEGNPEVARMARKYFAGWEEMEKDGRVEVEIADPSQVLDRAEPSFDLIVVDSAVLPTMGSAPFLTDRDWRGLIRALSPPGAVVMGGIAAGREGEISPVEEVMARGATLFERASLYRAVGTPAPDALLRGAGTDGALLLLSQAGSPPWPDVLPGFQLDGSEPDVHPGEELAESVPDPSLKGT
jgi:hypothetical protein